MSDKIFREVVTIGGRNVVLNHSSSPVENAGAVENADMQRVLNIFSDKYQPSNFSKADGTPLRLFTSPGCKIDVSKRSKEDMGFWHRNIDANEVILCIKGALRWETEIGTTTLYPGDMLLIPKGIAHRSMLCEDSLDENVLLELKVTDELVYTGDNK